MARFVHLRAHSAYSLLEGAIKIDRLIGLAKANGMPALGLCDRGNLFGALEFSEKAAGAGLQPIVGMTLPVVMDTGHERGLRGTDRRAVPQIALLASTEAGYLNLMRLTSELFEATDVAMHAVSDRLLADHAEGLIALTGGSEGPINLALCDGHGEQAEARLDRLAEMFGDRLYVELQRHGQSDENAAEAALLDLAYAKSLPIVATNQVFFAEASDFEAHDALRCIALGRAVSDPERPQLSSEYAFKSAEDMAKAFADLPEAIAMTVEIAQRCCYRPTTCAPILPRFAGDMSEEAEELRRQAEAGLAAQLAKHGLAADTGREIYNERLAFELDVIERMQYPGYFLIVADFIKWAKAQGVPVGPGRGSGAGSLVAWALTITDIDPMRFGLLFERFLNPERVSMPDFDIDFCPTGRDAVIQYVCDRYGHDRVAQIITFGTLQARAVVRDVARVLGIPYGRADKLSKMIPHNPAKPVTLKQAIDSEPGLKAARDEDANIAQLLDISLGLEGLFRHASTHAAGIVIGDRPLTELVPLYRDPRAQLPATQFNMKWVEQAGLVKFDFLGLKTLTILQRACESLATQGISIDISAIPLDDAPTYEMLSRGETMGIFQLESGGMRTAILGMRPDRFEDIIALVALYRPGPMENIPTYNNRKHGREQPDFIHPKLEPLLRETFGVIVYQEQVMQIAQQLAGYSLGEADLLRRAMGKKIQSEMDKQRPRFIDGAGERGIDTAKAGQIFDLLAKFADYGFNKSHAAAYALVAYQTAYLKANHPVAFLAASMTVDSGNTAKLNDFRAEAARLGIALRPPCVNHSGVDFQPADGAIQYALSAIRNVGISAAEHVVDIRGDRPFRDVWDFCQRIDPRILNKRALESLIAAGALDRLEPNRSRLIGAVDRLMETAGRAAEQVATGQSELFAGDSAPRLELPDAHPWTDIEKLRREYDALGSFLSGHPLDAYESLVERQRATTLGDLEENARKGATAGRVAAIVVSKAERRARNGNKVGIIGLSDPTGQVECMVFSEILAENRHLFEPGSAILAVLKVEMDNDLLRARIQEVRALDAVAADTSSSLRLFLKGDAAIDGIGARLSRGGEGAVSVVVVTEPGGPEVEIALPGRYMVSPLAAQSLRTVPGVLDAVVE